MIDITQSNRPLWHQNLTHEQVEAEAEKDYAKVIYNLHEDCLCLREELAESKYNHAYTESRLSQSKAELIDTLEQLAALEQSVPKIKADAIRLYGEHLNYCRNVTLESQMTPEEYAKKIEDGS